MSPTRLLALARSYGPLRAVEPHQAAVVRAAAVYDRRVLPRWQRAGDGVHQWCSPADYGIGRTWVRRSLGPVPGATGRAVHGRVEVQAQRPHVQWRTREHWTDTVVPAALRERPDALTTPRGRVLPATFLLWAHTIAQHAHDRTGRRCVVRVDRLAELMEVSKSTVQRCQLAAETLGLYVVLVPGRMLTEEETYEARRRGSRQRGLANDAALVVPAWIGAEQISTTPPPPPQFTNHETVHPRPVRRGTARGLLHLVPPVDNRLGGGTDSPVRCGLSGPYDTPTSGRLRKSYPSPSTDSFSTEQRSARESEPPPVAPHRRNRVDSAAREPHPLSSGTPSRSTAPSERPTGRSYDPNALQLARNLADRLSWLRSTAPGRLEPGLRRFTSCATPWRAQDVIAAIDATNRRLGRASMTADRAKHPPALLASYLRELDVDADHPDPDYGHHGDPVGPEGRRGLRGFDAGDAISARTHHNRLLLEAHREAQTGAGAARTPEVAVRTAAQIRVELRQRRTAPRARGRR